MRIAVYGGRMDIIQRAFELARSGECKSKEELEKRLRREGFSAVHGHLAGHRITSELRSAFAATKGRTEEGGVEPQA